MPDKQHQTPTGELSYYGLSLLSYLKDSHPELIAEGEVIAERADSAAQASSEAIRSGCNHIEAEEIAREELCRGVLEKYDLTDDCADTPDYELFDTELTGTVQILLEDGIQ